MKKFTRWALALGLCLALTVCVALAAEDGGIFVQLDGENLTFTDAVPQVKDQRTYLPFRAVFEAMGAEVSNEGNVITAVRGDKTLTMTIGSTEAAVVSNGLTVPLQMDVAPYVDNTSWRTYVPVRFAAQAFDCVVGWDQANTTAIIIDTEKLAREAQAGKRFTYLEKLAAMGEKYSEGIWDMDAAFTADMTMFSMPMMSMEGAVNGTTQGSERVSMNMNMTMDMSGLMAFAGSMGGETPSAEDQAMLEALKAEGVDLSMRGDMTSGKLYMNMDFNGIPVASGWDDSAWYELDMAALLAQVGMDWTELMSASRSTSMLDALPALLSAAEPTDSTTAYGQVKGQMEELFAAFADDKFVQSGDARSLVYYLPVDSGTVALTLELTMKDDEVADYAIRMMVTSSEDVSADQSVAMGVFVHMDAEGKMDAEIGMDVGQLVSLSMDMSGCYVPGTTAPVVTPPEGAKIVPFTDLMGGDLGVIGGADGPTAVFVGGAA